MPCFARPGGPSAGWPVPAASPSSICLGWTSFDLLWPVVLHIAIQSRPPPLARRFPADLGSPDRCTCISTDRGLSASLSAQGVSVRSRRGDRLTELLDHAGLNPDTA